MTGFTCVAQTLSPNSPANLLKELPLRFEENQGQVPGAAPFIAVGPTYRLEVSPGQNRFLLASPGKKDPTAIRTRFIGANSKARVEAREPLAATSNYFLSSSPREWHTALANYGRLETHDIYRDIDLIFYGSAGSLEYDFNVLPGADSTSIQFEITGARSIHLTAEGELVLSTDAGEVRWKNPEIYQDSARGREVVAGGFQLGKGKRVGFWIGEYDHNRTLVIDPKLAYGGYFGGPLTLLNGFENSRGVAVDGAGNIYIAGISSSGNLPVTTGVVQPGFGGLTANLRYLIGDAFVAKFTPSGALSYVTYLGGTGDDAALALAVDSDGNAYVTGLTNSSNFPVTAGVLQPKYKGAGGNSCTVFGDAFVTKISPSGSKLIYSTYLGGSLDDFAAAIAIDGQGNAYVAGATRSTDFSTINAYQSAWGGSGGEPRRPSCNGAPLFDGGDAFVVKLNPLASSLIFSSYLGGNQDDVALSIAIDAAQNVYVGGFTLSINFPTTTGALQTEYNGADAQNEFLITGDGFITKLNSTGTTAAYSTYLGGHGDDAVWALAVDKAGTVYAAGNTSSTNFPVTTSAVQRNYGGYFDLPFLIEQNLGDAFVCRLDQKGAKMLYSTFLGGAGNDQAMGIAVDASGVIYVAGFTDSMNFPVTADAVQASFAGDETSIRENYLPTGDGFFAMIDPSRANPLYSTYSGGQYNDLLQGLALDLNGNVWTTGVTASPDIKVTANAFQKNYTGASPRVNRSTSSPIAGQAMIVGFSNIAGATGPSIQAITNAASGKAGVVSPGMIFTVYGANLGSSTLVGSAVDPVTGLLSATLAGTTVLFDGIAAPLVYVTSDVVAGTVPYGVAGKSTTKVSVEVAGQRSPALVVPVHSTSPGLFAAAQNGKGEAVAFQYINGQQSLNSPANPAPAGSVVVIYLTGEGQTNPAGQDGVFGGSPVPKPAAPVSLTIGGVPQTDIAYAGSIPGSPPGVLQVNFTVAAGTPSGVQPIFVQVGGVSSQDGMTIAIQ